MHYFQRSDAKTEKLVQAMLEPFCEVATVHHMRTLAALSDKIVLRVVALENAAELVIRIEVRFELEAFSEALLTDRARAWEDVRQALLVERDHILESSQVDGEWQMRRPEPGSALDAARLVARRNLIARLREEGG